MIEHMLKEGELASSDYQGIKKDTLVLPTIYTDKDISSIKFDYTTLDNKILQENSDIGGEIDMPYEEDEILRPFSENYNLDTLDFVAMKQIARGEYREFDDVKFAQENYDSNYEYNEATDDAYFRIDADDEKETATYEKTKEENEEELQNREDITEEREDSEEETEQSESEKEAEEDEEEKNAEQESSTKINPIN